MSDMVYDPSMMQRQLADTPIIAAARSGAADAVGLLLEAGARPTAKNLVRESHCQELGKRGARKSFCVCVWEGAERCRVLGRDEWRWKLNYCMECTTALPFAIPFCFSCQL